ncbi:MAG: hypothetical protein WBV92_05230 [Nitrosotalea sp.]
MPEEIEWTPDFMLTVEHFLGISDNNDPYHAKSRTGIQYFFSHTLDEDKKRFKVKVEDIWTRAYFFPSQSWLKLEVTGGIHLPELLKHEQGHFDMAEKFSRKFDRKLKNEFRKKTFVFHKKITIDPIDSTSKIIQNYFVEINEQVEDEHAIYDKETNHGTIIEQQEKYNMRFSGLRNLHDIKRSA